jgi:hypothetical protein
MPEELAPPGEPRQVRPIRLSVQGGVAHADFTEYAACGGGSARFRIGLEDGVIAVTDCGDSMLERGLGETALCRVVPELDLEVRALSRGDHPTETRLAGPLLRVIRHSTGEVVFTFGDEFYFDPVNLRPVEQGSVFLAPEQSDSACCPSGTGCRLARCRTSQIAADGCRWIEVVSPADGFCHARQVF